eukprot:137492_1
MASTLGTELLLLLVSVSIGHCSNVCLSHLINGPTINTMDTNSAHYNLTLITTLGFIATVVMAVLNIIDWTFVSRDSLLFANFIYGIYLSIIVAIIIIVALICRYNTLITMILWQTGYLHTPFHLDFTRKHLLYRHDHPLYPSSVFQRVICTLFYVQSCVILMHRVRVNLKPLRMMNVNNDLSNVNTRNTSLLENYLKPQNVLFVQAIPTVMHTNAINTLNALNTHDGIPRNFAPIEIEFEFESPNTTDPTSMAFSWRIPQQRHETPKHTLRHHLDHKKHHYSSANLRKIATTTHRTLSFNSNASFGTVFSVRYLCTFGLYSLLMCLTFLLLFYCDYVVFFFVLFCYFYISITFLSLLLLVLLSLIYGHTWRVYKYDTPHYRNYLILFYYLILYCIYLICLCLNVSSSLCHARVYIISTFCILYITVVFWSNNILAKEPDEKKKKKKYRKRTRL